MGRLLIVAGLFLIGAGLLFQFGAGRLPGDIYIRGKNTTFYFPLVTCLLLSAVLSFVLWLFRR